MGAKGSFGLGHDPGYYCRSVGAGKGEVNYHTGAVDEHGEEPGRWMGVGAAALGLAGEVDANDMTDLYGKGLDPRDPRWSDPEAREHCARFGSAPRRYKTAEEILAAKLAAEPNALPERVDELRAEAVRTARQSVQYVDFTFNPSKDITVLRTAWAWAEAEAVRTGDQDGAAYWRDRRVVLEEGARLGNAAAVEYLSEHAGYVRTGAGSGGVAKWADAHQLIVASFYQRTSREGDPQDHFHNVILPKAVSETDGKVLALDTTLIRDAIPAAVAIGQRIMSEYHAQHLGLRQEMRPDGVGREIVGVDQAAKELFSSSSRRIGPKLAAWADAYQEQYGREPNALQVDRMRRQIHLEYRQSKNKLPVETRGEELERWDRQLRREVAGGMRRIAERLGLAEVQVPEAQEWSPTGVIAEAVAAVQAKKSAWTRSDLIVDIDKALPDHLGVADPQQITILIEALADAAIETLATQVAGATTTPTVPAELQLANGRSAYARPGGERYASHDHVVAEYALRRAAVERGRRAVDKAAIDGWLAQAEQDMGEFGADQKAAIRGILSSGAVVSTLVGPAGAGKSWTMGGLSAAWTDLTGGRVIGLAETERATEVLREDGVTAKNVTQWLNAQERLDQGRASGDDAAWEVRQADIVVVDEASMNNTAAMTRILEQVNRAGARMLQTGDPHQLGAVGAGGAMAMIAETHGADVHTLAEIRRFRDDDGSVRQWEAEASLGLRAGKVEALTAYETHGRLRDGGTVDEALAAAAKARVVAALEGKDAMTVVATNEYAATVNALVRERLAALGKVGAAEVALRDGTDAGTGDLVQCRRNDYRLKVTNRRLYTVEVINEDGSATLKATDGSGLRTVPAAYLERDVTLGYGGTVHAVQGATIEVGAAMTHGMDREALYVAMSRGWRTNVAYVPTNVNGEDLGTPRTVLAGILEQEREDNRAALVRQADDARAAGSMKAIAAQFEDGVRRTVSARTVDWFDQLTTEGVLSEHDRQALAADQGGTEQLSRLLRSVELAGHDAQTVLRDAVASRSLDDAHSPALALHYRITSTCANRLAPREDLLHTAPAKVGDEWAEHFETLAQLAEDRRHVLGSEVAEEQPQWAVEAFGSVPDEPVERLDWERKAGIVAAHREATECGDEIDPIGISPGLSASERRASWHAAWSALGRPETTREEQELGEGALRVRVKSWQREVATQPPYVRHELARTAEEAAKHQEEATLREAEAAAAVDAAERARLMEEVDELRLRAEVLAEREAELREIAEVRDEWRAQTAATIDLGERAAKELERRERVIGQEPDATTAVDWLAEHQAAMVAEDPHREVYEADVAGDAVQDVEADIVHQAEGEAIHDVSADIVNDEVAVEAEPDMPAGVPSAVEVEVAVTAAAVVAEDLADQRSAEDAHRQAEADRRATEEEAAREVAYRAEQERLAAERATEDQYEDAWD